MFFGFCQGMSILIPVWLMEMVPDWKEFIQVVSEPEDYEKLRRHERTGRPLGNKSFIEKLEALLQRGLKPRKPGPKGPRKHKSFN